MKAIVISSPGNAVVAERGLGSLGPQDVRIKVLATGVCGTDVELFEGTMPYLISGMARYPFTPGHEWVGEIQELGAAVRDFSVGDRVVGECSCGCLQCERCRAGHYHRCVYRTETGILNRSGAFAEFIDFPACFMHRVSKDVPLESACLIEPAAVAFNGVRRAQVSPKDDVAILGDGPIGLLLLMMSKAFGARSVTVLGASADRLAVGHQLGAERVINVLAEGARERLSQIRASAPPSIVIEATGRPESVAMAVDVAAPGGKIILQGIFAGQRLSGVDLDRIVIDEISVEGALGSPSVWPDVIRLIESGRVNPAALVTASLPLEGYRQAIENVKARVGVKNIVRPNTC